MSVFNNRVLIVDDSEDIHESYKLAILEKNSGTHLDSLVNDLFAPEHATSSDIQNIDYDITFAFQGEEAVELVKKSIEQQKPYALIYMDIRMPPGIDGLQALKKIWEIDSGPEVVICSAYSDYKRQEVLDMLGITDQLLFLKKPFEFVEIQQMTLSLVCKWNLKRELKEQIRLLQTQNK